MNFNTMEDELITDHNAINKLNLSMHSKPSGNTSGRMTPPSNYSSHRRGTQIRIGRNSGASKKTTNDEGTGSV